MIERKTAGELSHEAQKDKTDYNVLEVAHAICDDIGKELRICIENHKKIIDEEEFCIVRVIAKDPLINTLTRYKYYAWPYLPSPRPDQAVFLYNKSLDCITKRLWVLPNAFKMAQLASTNVIVPKEYQTMQAWSVAFYKGTFWEYVRHDQKITMLSEHEYFLAHREELIKAGCKPLDPSFSEAFDFSKIQVEKIVDTKTAMPNQGILSSSGKAQDA